MTKTFISASRFLLAAVFYSYSIAIVVRAQFYAPPNMDGSVGCVVTGNKLYSHGNYIRDLKSEELQELSKYRKDLLDFKEKVNSVYANIDTVLKRNGSLPTLPTRPQLPTFCANNETTLYILGGCTVQNYKVYIGGKFARELNSNEKEQLDQFARQMVAANYAAAQAAAATHNPSSATNGTLADASQQVAPVTTTISPATEAGRQIALDFCMEL